MTDATPEILVAPAPPRRDRRILATVLVSGGLHLLLVAVWLKSVRKPTVILPLFQNTLMGGLSSSLTCIWAITTFCAKFTFCSVMVW